MPLSGGDKLKAYLAKLEKKVGGRPVVQAGFMEDATYQNGTPIAYIAAVNEFGGTAQIPEHEVTVYRKLNKAGTEYLRKGRFVKKSQANVETTHTVAAHTVTVPSRPFFRTAIAAGEKTWGKLAGDQLKANDYDLKKTLTQVGEQMVGDITKSIRDFSDPPNAPSTIAKKGFNDPLIDKGDMVRAVTSRIAAGEKT